jgi:hypothetical protein
MYQVDMYGVAAIAFALLFGYEAIDDMQAVPHEIEGLRCYMLPRGRYKHDTGKVVGPGDLDEVWLSTFAILLNGRVGVTRGETFHFSRVQMIRDALAEFVRTKKVDADKVLSSLMTENRI